MPTARPSVRRRAEVGLQGFEPGVRATARRPGREGFGHVGHHASARSSARRRGELKRCCPEPGAGCPDHARPRPGPHLIEVSSSGPRTSPRPVQRLPVQHKPSQPEPVQRKPSTMPGPAAAGPSTTGPVVAGPAAARPAGPAPAVARIPRNPSHVPPVHTVPWLVRDAHWLATHGRPKMSRSPLSTTPSEATRTLPREASSEPVPVAGGT